MKGDADLAKIGALVADPAHVRILLALGDGRALPASVLADEAEVAPSTARRSGSTSLPSVRAGVR
jgi:hypothetical protein